MAFSATAAPAAGRTIFHDGFESETFSAWSEVQLGGDAKAGVQSAVVASGSLAAMLTESAHRGSRVDIRKAFRGAYVNLAASGEFRVLRQGAADLPLLRLLDARARPVATVFRRGTSIYVAYGGRTFRTRGSLGLRRWAAVSLHATLSGRRRGIEVRVHGRLVYRGRQARLGGPGISILQVGNDAASRPFALVVDAITVQNLGPARRSPPINTGSPVVFGAPQAGWRVHASRGDWGGTPVRRYSYRWLRCNLRGVACRTAPGARRPSYKAGRPDVGRRLRVVVTAVNAVGASRSTSRATSPVQPASAPPARKERPSISGIPRDGQLLSAAPGNWSGTQPIAYRYQWLRCDFAGAGCGAIRGATNATYVVRSFDIGDTLRVAVRAANRIRAAAALSPATGRVQKGPRPTIAALWHMDERSGTRMFDPIGSHNGTMFHVQLRLPGVSGSAYGFNGSSSYVSVPSAHALNPGAASVSATIHVQTTGTPPPSPADWDVIRKGLYTKRGAEYKMELQQSGQASCGFEGTRGYADLIAGPVINDGEWHTVQCAKTSSQIKVIVDGVTYAQSATIGSITNSSPVVIGARPGSDWYRGALDEASIQVG